MYMSSYSEIALVHDTRHLRTRLRVVGIEAMSRVISGGKQVKNLPTGLIAVEFVYSVKTV